MTPQNVTPNDIGSKIDELSEHVKAHVTEPKAEVVRNLVIGVAVIVVVAYAMGRGSGKRKYRSR